MLSWLKGEPGDLVIIAIAVLAVVLGAIALYYRRFIVEQPRLVYRHNVVTDAVVNACPALHNDYRPTAWASNTHLQIGLLLLKEARAPKLAYEQSDVLTMADGGTTSVDWLGLALGEQVPTVILLHTITGCGESIGSYSRYLHQKLGWRIAVCVRRGHGNLPLTAPQVNTLGSTDDLREQLSHIQQQLPQSPLYAIGVSAGSGLLVRYLGEEEERTPIKAAFAYCPAYDTDVAFTRAAPFYSAYMAKKLIRYFLEPNSHHFRELASFKPCAQSRDLDEFHQHCYELAGFRDQQEFSQYSNPMRVIDGIRIPLMVLNSRDDPICSSQNIDDHAHAITGLEGGILVVTARGSHCAHFEGWTGRPWAHKLMAQYLAANYALLKRNQEST